MSAFYSWPLYLALITICSLFGLAIWINLGKAAKRADEETEDAFAHKHDGPPDGLDYWTCSCGVGLHQ